MDKIYDSIFRTLCERNPELLIPLVNEFFEEDHNLTDQACLLAGEHHVIPKDYSEIITDSSVRINNKIYHIECQSSPDDNKLKIDYELLYRGLIEAYNKKRINSEACNNIADMTNRLLEHVYPYNEISEEVRRMGGEVLVTYYDRVFEKGRKDGIMGIVKLVKDKVITISQAAEVSNMTVDDIQNYINTLNVK